MYLQLTEKLSPRHVALALLPHLPADQIEWDHENIYEWTFLDLPGLSFSLNVTRDHGMSHVEDRHLDTLSPEQIEALPTAGPTYIYGYDRQKNSRVIELPRELVQRISDALQSDILIYPGRLAIDKPDPKPIARTKPTPPSPLTNPTDPASPTPFARRDESLGRFLATQFLLSLIVSAVTLLVAYLLAGHSLTPLAYVGWSAASFILCGVFIIQNTVEGCVILIIWFVLLLFAAKVAPAHILYPAATAFLTSWLVTRIHRRYAYGMPWIE